MIGVAYPINPIQLELQCEEKLTLCDCTRGISYAGER